MSLSRIGELLCRQKLCSSFHPSFDLLKATKHVYAQLCPWDSVQSFVDALVGNICYNNDGLVIINKPYGISVTQQSVKRDLSESYIQSTAAVGNCWYSLVDALPHVADKLGYGSLSVIKTPGRYASGITILSANDSVTQTVKKSMIYEKARNKTIYNYWVLVIGQPQPDSGSERIGITLTKAPSGRESQVILETKWSQKSVKRKEIQPTSVEYSTLAKGSLASLVEIRTSRTRWHFIRLYSAYLLSPILGDHLYGGRVQSILGIPVAISPFSDHAKLPKALTKDLRSALELQSNEELITPAHIHFRSLRLRNYGGKDLTIIAPLPQHFLWSCRKLMLKNISDMVVAQHA